MITQGNGVVRYFTVLIVSQETGVTVTFGIIFRHLSRF